MNSHQKIAWRSMFKNEHPIKIVRVDSKEIEEEYGVAQTLEYEFGATILSSIRYNGVSYRPNSHTDYWFPGAPRPAELRQDIMMLYMHETSNLNNILIAPLEDSIPFMNSNGIFCNACEIVMKQTRGGKWEKLNSRIVTYDRGEHPLAVLVSDVVHSVNFASVFQEIPVIEIIRD
jgi:hypothetical protein